MSEKNWIRQDSPWATMNGGPLDAQNIQLCQQDVEIGVLLRQGHQYNRDELGVWRYLTPTDKRNSTA